MRPGRCSRQTVRAAVADGTSRGCNGSLVSPIFLACDFSPLKAPHTTRKPRAFVGDASRRRKAASRITSMVAIAGWTCRSTPQSQTRRNRCGTCTQTRYPPFPVRHRSTLLSTACGRFEASAMEPPPSPQQCAAGSRRGDAALQPLRGERLAIPASTRMPALGCIGRLKTTRPSGLRRRASAASRCRRGSARTRREYRLDAFHPPEKPRACSCHLT